MWETKRDGAKEMCTCVFLVIWLFCLDKVNLLEPIVSFDLCLPHHSLWHLSEQRCVFSEEIPLVVFWQVTLWWCSQLTSRGLCSLSSWAQRKTPLLGCVCASGMASLRFLIWAFWRSCMLMYHMLADSHMGRLACVFYIGGSQSNYGINFHTHHSMYKLTLCFTQNEKTKPCIDLIQLIDLWTHFTVLNCALFALHCFIICKIMCCLAAIM